MTAPNRQQRRAAKKTQPTTPAQKPTGPDGASCRTCRYFLADKDNPDQGNCRRFPPTPMVSQFAPFPGAQPGITTAFPTMMWFGWCGEYAVVK